MLVTLQRAKKLLGSQSTEDDLLLIASLAAASGVIENYLNRKLEYGTYRETLDAPSIPFLQLRQYPVHSVTRLDHHNQTITPDSYRVEPDNGMLFRRGGWGYGERTIQIEYVAGYVLPSDVVGSPPSTLPANYEYACVMLAQSLMRQPGVTSERVGDLSVNYKDNGNEIPGVVKSLLGG